MKHLKFIIIPLLSLILASCGSNLPAKSSFKAGEGIFAIPKSYINELNWSDGWKTDLQISDANGKVLDDLIRLHYINGRQFLFVKNLSPGQYTLSGYRRVGVGENAIKTSLPMVNASKKFTIVEGEVTVLPLIFHTLHKSAGYRRGSSFLKILPISEELEEFKAVMAKANKNNEWKVNWPK